MTGPTILVLLAVGASSAASPSRTVAFGRFATTPWRLSASDSSSGSFCLAMTLLRHLSSSECGSIARQGAGRIRGITYLAHSGALAPDYIVGAVVGTAMRVVITVTTGRPLTTKTIAAPDGMTSKIAFYVENLPCSEQPTSVRGLNAAGRTVAYLVIHRFRPLGDPTC